MVRFAVLALFALVTCLSTPQPTRAAVTTNYSDVWWNPSESGWGVNISQQADFLFVSFFVYGPNGQPFWYTAQLTFVGAAANGDLIYTGDNYVTSGPYFGNGTFDSSLVGVRRVGSATFTATSVISGVLQYAVDGINVTKSLVRQTLKAESLTGEYIGASTYVQTCTNPAGNGTQASVAEITIAHTGANFQMTTVDLTKDSCTLVGAYVQDGQVGRVSGPMTCTSGITGTFSYFEIQSSISGMMGRFNSSLSSGGITCSASGRLAAVKGF